MSANRNLALRLGIPAFLLFSGVACDYSGDWLFAGAVEGVPSVMHIYAEDGSELLVPTQATTIEELREGIIYAEVGPTGDAKLGGTTLNFLGTGGPVCIFVDPETVYWNWTINPKPNSFQKQFNYPDNIFDDGDVDLFVGLSAYYTGSPGVAVGDFVVNYSDSLGNEVPIELSECANLGYRGQLNAHAGRGFPEYCSIQFTDPGVSYTALLQTFSTPLDDDRLGYGLIVFDGTCNGLVSLTTGGNMADTAFDPAQLECVINGESIIPRPIKDNELTYCTGAGCADSWAGSIEFETEFCAGSSADMRKFCRREASQKFDEGIECTLEEVESIDSRCFCGDENDLPLAGAL